MKNRPALTTPPSERSSKARTEWLRSRTLGWLSAVCLSGAMVACGGQSAADDPSSGGSGSGSGDGGGASGRGSGSSSGGGITLPEPDEKATPQCFLEPDAGHCAEPETRFYYDREKKRCEPFEYSGCGGNDNNFSTKSSCTDFCFGYAGCQCEESEPSCQVRGACVECPEDLTIAEGKPCATVGLTCSKGGSCLCQKASDDAEPTWRCAFRL